MLILSAMVTSPSWGTGSGRPATPWASASTTSALATVTSSLAQRGERDVVVEWARCARRRRARIEPLLHLHEADARLAVAGQDGALDGRRAAPARQEREVQVHHRDLLEQPRRDDAAVGHHDRELDAGRRQVVHVVGHGEPELGGRHLDRARRLLLAPAAPAVGARDAECDVVARRDQRAQRRHGHVGGTEIRQAGHPLTVGQTADADGGTVAGATCARGVSG